MSKFYHYVYTLSDTGDTKPELLNGETLKPEKDINFRAVFLYLDEQSFSVQPGIIERLVEFAGREVRNRLQY